MCVCVWVCVVCACLCVQMTSVVLCPLTCRHTMPDKPGRGCAESEDDNIKALQAGRLCAL